MEAIVQAAVARALESQIPSIIAQVRDSAREKANSGEGHVGGGKLNSLVSGLLISPWARDEELPSGHSPLNRSR